MEIIKSLLSDTMPNQFQPEGHLVTSIFLANFYENAQKSVPISVRKGFCGQYKYNIPKTRQKYKNIEHI